MISRQQAEVQPWRRGGRSSASTGRHGRPSSLRDTINAHLEELRFRNGVMMLVAAVAVLAVIAGGLLTTLREESDPRRPAGRNAGPAQGPSSPSSGPSASVDPTRDMPTPPMASKGSKPPPAPVSPPTAPSTDARRNERPGWPTGMPGFPGRRHRHRPPAEWPYDQRPPWGDRR